MPENATRSNVMSEETINQTPAPAISEPASEPASAGEEIAGDSHQEVAPSRESLQPETELAADSMPIESMSSEVVPENVTQSAEEAKPAGPELQSVAASPETNADQTELPAVAGTDETAETPVAESGPITDVLPPALPEGHEPEPPRPLMVGAFLRLEFEIQEILARGLTNLYRAAGGEFGAPTLHLIAERDAQQDWPETALDSALFPRAERFTQEGRDYLVFDWAETTSLYDYRAPSNDEDYLRFMTQLAEALAELETQNLTADFSRELLRVDTNGHLKFYGFPASKGAGEETTSSMQELARLSGFLLKRVFAEAVTMRLGDEYGALVMSEEVKNFARRLDEGAFENAAHVAQTARDLCPPGEVRMRSELLTDVGQEREHNEDAGAILQLRRDALLGRYHLDAYIVSDGMGGHEGGEVASDLTLTSLQNALHQRAAQINWQDNVQVKAVLLDIIDEVNRAVVNLTETPAYRGQRAKPGATLTFALRLGRRVFVGNVGDSRAYRWNEAEGLQRISKDHSYVQSLIDQGELTEEESWDHPDGSIITAHIGDPKLRLKDVFLRLFKPGDKLLIVSDGVTDMLRDHEIAVYVKENDPAEVVRDLVDASNTAGGADNITALCVIFD
jgi:protein phosphatase